jgi:hypothetical protein
LSPLKKVGVLRITANPDVKLIETTARRLIAMSSFGIVDDSQCAAAGVDPDVVNRVARRLVQVCREAERLGLDLAGSLGTVAVRPANDPRHPVLSRVYTGAPVSPDETRHAATNPEEEDERAMRPQ